MNVIDELMTCTPDFFTFLAEDATKQEPTIWAMLTFLPLVIALFYVIVLLPASKERKKQDDMIKGLKKGDRVITTGGIIGSVVTCSPDSVEITLRVEDNVKIKFHRNFITSVLTEDKKDDVAAKT